MEVHLKPSLSEIKHKKIKMQELIGIILDTLAFLSFISLFVGSTFIIATRPIQPPVFHYILLLIPTIVFVLLVSRRGMS